MATGTDASGPVGLALRLLQFGDSVLPVGAFSFSNGLESAVQLGVVRDRETLESFVRSALWQSESLDGIALLAAFRAAIPGEEGAARIDEADHALFARRLNEETRTMTARMGRKLAEIAERLLGRGPTVDWLGRIRQGKTPGCYPIGQGLVFAGLGLDERTAFAAQQYGVASMMVSAALRLMRIHYLDTQAVLLSVASDADAAYGRIAGASLDQMASYAPTLDILAAAHVRAHVRMFMN